MLGGEEAKRERDGTRKKGKMKREVWWGGKGRRRRQGKEKERNRKRMRK